MLTVVVKYTVCSLAECTNSSEKVLDRGEKFELLVDRTDKLNRQSVKFERSTVELRKTMWRRNVKLWMLLVFVGLVCSIRFVILCDIRADIQGLCSLSFI